MNQFYCNISHQFFNKIEKIRVFIILLFAITHTILNAQQINIDNVYYEVDTNNYTAKVVGLACKQSYRQGTTVEYCVYDSYGSYNIHSEIEYNGETYIVDTISSLNSVIGSKWNNTWSYATSYTNKISIEEGIKYISDGVFKDACIYPSSNENKRTPIFSKSLTIDLPSSLEVIGNSSFEGISFSNNLEFPSHLKNIGEYAFKESSFKNTDIIIPNSVETIGNGIFMNCKSVENVKLSNILTEIPDYAFMGCSNLISIEIPRSIEIIGNHSFSGCSALNNISLPKWLTSIGESTFEGCSSILSMELPSTLTTIGKSAFKNCNRLQNLIIPENIKYILEETFSGCYSLETVVLPNEIESLGDKAFNECTNLKDFDIPANVAIIGNSCFSGCKSLKEIFINNSVRSIGSLAFVNCSNLEVVKIGDNIKILPAETFRYCNNLATVIIGKNISEIGGLCFDNCKNIKKIECNNHVPPSLIANSFDEDVYDNAILYVPDNALESYKTAKIWKYFSNQEIIPIKAESIKLSVYNLEIKVGQNFQIIAEIYPEDSTDTIVWHCSDTNIIHIDNEGNLIGINPGKALVTANVNDISAVCEVSVLPVEAESIELNENALQLKIGETFLLNAEILPQNTTDKTLTWKSSDSSIVSVNESGEVTALSVGNVIISVNCGEIYTFCEVNVIPVYAEKIILDKTDIEIHLDEEYKISAIIYPENTTYKELYWESDNPEIATVDSNGIITGKSIGITTITASCGEIKATCNVTVVPVPVSSIKINSSEVDIYVGETINLKATIYPENATNKTLIWTSSNPYVATIDSVGNVKALHKGNTIITASCDNVSTQSLINVTAPPLDECYIIWNQKFECSIGQKIELTGRSSMENLPISYKCVVPDGGYRDCEITEEEGRWFVTFGKTGPTMIESWIEGVKGTEIRKQFNVVSEPDGLMHIDGIYYRYCDDNRNSLKVVYGYEPYCGDYIIPSVVNGLPVLEIDRQAFYTCKQLGNVVLSEGIEKMKYESFGNNSLTSIYIPKSISKIDDFTFNASRSISDVYLHWLTPIEANENIFNASDTFKNAILHIPGGTRTRYQSTECWNHFVNIIDDLPGLPESIQIQNKENRILLLGSKLQLSAIVLPEDAVDRSVVWNSSDDSIAMVDSEGNVTAISLGCAIITATCGDVSDFIEISVQPVVATAIAIDKSEVELRIGESDILTATIFPEDTTNKTIVWSSSNPEVAKVDQEGNVTAFSIGEAIVTATCGNVKATCRVTVNPIEATSIELDKTEIQLVIGESQKLEAMIVPEDTTDKTLVWSSSDITVASVDSEGNVTAISVGEAIITATCGNVKTTCKVKVNPISASSITIDKTEIQLTIGDSDILTATVFPENTTDKTIVWSSSNPEVATVDKDGHVIAISKGETTITVSCGNVSVSCYVKVVNPSVDICHVIWNQNFRNSVGERIQLTGYSSMPEFPVIYRCERPDGGYRNCDVFEEDGIWYALFTEVGPTMIEAWIEGLENTKIRKQFNVVDDHDNLIQINGIYYSFCDESRTSLKVVYGYEPYEGDITIPSYANGLPVKKIERQAFYTCKKLGSVVISEDIEEIDYEAFGNNSLIEINIPQSVSKIANYAFNATKTITDIYVHWLNPVEVNENIFNASNTFVNATLHIPTGTLSRYKNTECWNHFANIVEDMPGLPESIKIQNKDNRIIILGNHLQLNAIVLPEDAVDKYVVWTSSDDSIATVDSDGNVTAISPGSAIITATCCEVSDFIEISVQPVIATAIALDKTEVVLRIGESDILTATVLPEDTTDKTIKWSSSNPEVAIVDQEGNISAISEGETTITAKCCNVVAYCKVKVNRILASSIYIDKTEIQLTVGESERLSATVLPEDTTDKTIIWSSSNPEVATVDQEGSITAISKGDASITVSCGNMAVSCQVTVVNPSVDICYVIWDQEFRNSVGERIQLTGSSSMHEFPVRYRCVQPNGGYRNCNVFEEDGNWYASFTDAGPTIIEAWIEGIKGSEIRKQFNVVSDPDGLMFIDGIYYRYCDDRRNSLKVVYGYEPYAGDYVIPSFANDMPVIEVAGQAFYSCNQLKSVVISEGIEKLGYESFGNCSLMSINIPRSVVKFDEYVFNASQQINDIYVHWYIPTEIDMTIFNETNAFNQATLHIPSNALNKYMEADYWQDFFNIVGDQHGVSKLSYIFDDSASVYYVYLLNGMFIGKYEDDDIFNKLQPGVYIINGKKIIIN